MRRASTAAAVELAEVWLASLEGLTRLALGAKAVSLVSPSLLLEQAAALGSPSAAGAFSLLGCSDPPEDARLVASQTWQVLAEAVSKFAAASLSSSLRLRLLAVLPTSLWMLATTLRSASASASTLSRFCAARLDRLVLGPYA